MRTPACIRIAHPHSRTDNLYRSGGNETIKRTNQIIHTFTLRLLYFPAHEKRTKIDINITNTRCNLYRIPQSNAVCGANSNHFVWSSHTRRIQTPKSMEIPWCCMTFSQAEQNRRAPSLISRGKRLLTLPLVVSLPARNTPTNRKEKDTWRKYTSESRGREQNAKECRWGRGSGGLRNAAAS